VARQRVAITHQASRRGAGEWIGEEFDPDEFAVEIADAAITARFRRK